MTEVADTFQDVEHTKYFLIFYELSYLQIELKKKGED